MSYMYTTSSDAAVTAMLVNEGSLFCTMISKSCGSLCSDGLPSSVAMMDTMWLLLAASLADGVPSSKAVPSPLSVSVNQAGSVGAVMVSVSPGSMSLAMTV